MAVPRERNSSTCGFQVWLEMPSLVSTTGVESLAFGLHPRHRKLARLVERLREHSYLGIGSRRTKDVAEAPVSYVIDTVPHHQAQGPESRTEQLVEALSVEVGSGGWPLPARQSCPSLCLTPVPTAVNSPMWVP